MAILHVNSANGSPTAPYETWAKAATTLAVAASASAAGDTIYVDSAHSETSVGTITFPGTKTNPTKVLSGTHAGASGLDALAAGAQMAATTTTISVQGSFYAYGLVFTTSGASGGVISVGTTTGNVTYLDNCQLLGLSTDGTANVNIGNSSGGDTSNTLRSCIFGLGATTKEVRVNSRVLIQGGSWSASTAANNTVGVFCPGATATVGTVCEINGMDFLNCGNTFVLFQHQTSLTSNILRARNCKMPASWAPTTLAQSTMTGVASTFELVNYGAGDTNYKFWAESSWGRAQDETTVKRTTGGASDGATSYSWKLTTTANAVYPSSVFRSPPIYKRFTAAGTSKTVTVQMVHDGASAFTDAEVWLEVEYLGTDGYPIGAQYNNRCSVLASPGAYSASGTAWDGDTETGPNGSSTWQQIAPALVTGNIYESGYIVVTVCMTVASKVLYVDPQVTLS